MLKRGFIFCAVAASLIGACSGGSAVRETGRELEPAAKSKTSPQVKGAISSLPDLAYFHQQDARWASAPLGRSGDTLKTDGCLVSASAMALSNLGFSTDPGDLTARLNRHDGFNTRGWLVWSGLERVTGNKAKTRFFTDVSPDHIRACMDEGYYPLVKFKLPSRQPHWAVVVAETRSDFYVRDPMVNHSAAIPLKARAAGIDAVRCIGVN